MPSGGGFILLLDGYGGARQVLEPLGSQTGSDGDLTALVYELLDAHGDTMRLADGLEAAPGWAAHLDYLRDLQRVGREALAWRERAVL
jgi:hypothetical protein